MKHALSLRWLEDIYQRHNKRSLAYPDPIVFLYEYPNPEDREIAALLAASLAYGRVAQILKSVDKILSAMGPSPAAYLVNATSAEIAEPLADFKHRFTTGKDVARLLTAAKNILLEFGSLEKCFLRGFKHDDIDILPALADLAEKLDSAETDNRAFPLFPSPKNGGACKRPMLFLRWLVRSDDVDPGGWTQIPPAKLIVPLDTHMRKIATTLGLLSRKTPDLKAAKETTAAFAEFNPNDPVKYDFALTRFGIRNDMDPADLR
jgi:uncharacterized protein (TIGR02757 family)